MYIPPRYQVTDDAAIDAFLRTYGFGTLVSHGTGGLMATHLPFELWRDPDGTRRLCGHVSRANPQWHQLEEVGEALVVVLGPHTYISPTWYDHPNVPTWNYQAVHAYGTVRTIHDPGELALDLRALTQHHEPPSQPDPRFDLDAMPADLRAAQLRGIVGLELTVNRIEAAFKLSQNRHDADRARIVQALRSRGDDASRAIADAIEVRPA